MTSVTISDDLRRKLKVLAAKYDTNQAEIIKKSVELFEKVENGEIQIEKSHDEIKTKNNENLTRLQQFKQDLDKATENFENNYPEIAQFYKQLRKNPENLEEITINHWDLPFEED